VTPPGPGPAAAAGSALDGATVTSVHVARPATPATATDASAKGSAKDGKAAAAASTADANSAAPASPPVGVPAPDAAQAAFALDVAPSAASASRDGAPSFAGKASERDDKKPTAGSAHTPAVTPPATQSALADAAPRVDAAPKVHAAAPIELPQPPHHSGSARASITVGEGDDRVALHISTNGGHVRVTAAAASQQLANEMNRDAGDLRESLRQHGLDLAELHAGTSTDTQSQSQSPPQQQQQPREPEAAHGRHDGRIQPTQTEAATPTPARRVLA
jgi:hypothetical protein